VCVCVCVCVCVLCTNYVVNRFCFAQNDRFADVMSSVAQTESVSENNVIMFINDRTIQSHDSPRSLGITVADIIGLFLFLFTPRCRCSPLLHLSHVLCSVCVSVCLLVTP